MSSVTEEPEVAERERESEPPAVQDESAANAQGGPAAEAAKRPLYKRPLFLLVAGLVLVLALVFGVRYWLYARAHESTDDAFIDGHIVQISPKVSGYVARVYVTDNQEVKEGDLLAEIDPRDFEAQLAEAEAALAAGQARLKEAQTSVVLTRAIGRAGVQQASSVVRGLIPASKRPGRTPPPNEPGRLRPPPAWRRLRPTPRRQGRRSR